MSISRDADLALDEAATHAEALLKSLGLFDDPDSPRRMAKALHELTAGRDANPRRHLAVQFPPTSSNPGLIVVNDVPFTSVCEHHFLPFSGVATVAYLPKPGRKIVGLSKLARLVQEYAARPQVQERLTEQVVTAIEDVLDPRGAACAIRASHSCMALRGAKTGLGAAMTTVQHSGELASEPWRGEFAAHIASWRS